MYRITFAIMLAVTLSGSPASAIAESGNICSGGCCGNGVGCSGGQ